MRRPGTRGPRRRGAFSASCLIGLAACAWGCSQSGTSSPNGPATSAEEEIPEFSEADWEVLRSLAPTALPPPPEDVSNAWADDPAAAAFGQKLFFDTRFSGALLDVDNDGGPNSMGKVGDTGRVSCESCHMAKSGFSDTRSTFQEISLGTGWTLRRTPSVLDVGQAKVIMWGGRHSTLYAQVFGPMENPLEMNSSRLYVAHLIAEHYRDEYESIFGTEHLAELADTERFPRLTADETGCRMTRAVDHPRALPPNDLYECRGMPGDGADYDGMASADQELVTRIVVNMGKAIGAYERLLSCGPSAFDDFVQGRKDALSPSAQRGLSLFIGKADCVSCHSGPYLSDQKFYNVGLAEEPTREGILNGHDRGAAQDLQLAADDPLGITGPYSDGDDGRLPEVDAEHEGAFRTPTLRCVNQRPTFMHSGLLESLDQVVLHFDRGGDPDITYPGTSVIEPLGLDASERADIVAFLRALDGPGPDPDLLQAP